MLTQTQYESANSNMEPWEKQTDRAIEYWWARDEGETHVAVRDIGKRLRDRHSGIRALWAEALSHYEGLVFDHEPTDGDVASLAPSSFSSASRRTRSFMPLTRMAIDTQVARTAGKQRPMPDFLTNGADYQTTRRAKKLRRIVEGQLRLRQGTYSSVWEMCERECAVDWGLFGLGCMKIYADTVVERVVYEPVRPWEIDVDDTEAERRNPMNFFHTYLYSKQKLIRRFGYEDDGKTRKADVIEAIQAAGVTNTRQWGMAGDMNSDVLEVTEAWRVRHSEDEPGRHVLCIDGHDLVDEEWDRDEPPFVFLWWAPHRSGWYASGVADQVLNLHVKFNEMLEAIQANADLHVHTKVVVEDDSVEEEEVQQSEAGTIWRVKSGKSPPNVFQPSPTSEGTFRYWERLRELFIEGTRISQMSMTGEKPAGVDAAIAMQTLDDIESQGFVVQSRAYETMWGSIGRHTVACLREIAAENDNALFRWPGDKQLREIAWSDAELDEDMYEVTVSSSSSLVGTRAYRMNYVTSLLEMGLIDPEQAREQLDLPDPEKIHSRDFAEKDYLEGLFDSYLDVTDAEEGAELYETPEPFFNLAAGVQLATSMYFEARRDRAPSAATKLLRRWIQEAAALQRKMKMQEAAIASGTAEGAQVAMGLEAQMSGGPEAAGPPSPSPAGPPPAAPPPAVAAA